MVYSASPCHGEIRGWPGECPIARREYLMLFCWRTFAQQSLLETGCQFENCVMKRTRRQDREDGKVSGWEGAGVVERPWLQIKSHRTP